MTMKSQLCYKAFTFVKVMLDIESQRCVAEIVKTVIKTNYLAVTNV